MQNDGSESSGVTHGKWMRLARKVDQTITQLCRAVETSAVMGHRDVAAALIHEVYAAATEADENADVIGRGGEATRAEAMPAPPKKRPYARAAKRPPLPPIVPLAACKPPALPGPAAAPAQKRGRPSPLALVPPAAGKPPQGRAPAKPPPGGHQGRGGALVLTVLEVLEGGRGRK